ncbi:hypothetical protein Gogos_003370, partial [Gossypium gossypioides]|nr:hypothetical protein [Gossypium gossypioides]
MLYRATEPNKMSIGGCMLLLQWNFRPSYVGLPEQLKDIRLLLDQCSKVEMSYVDQAIVECIPPENFTNRNMFPGSLSSSSSSVFVNIDVIV